MAPVAYTGPTPTPTQIASLIAAAPTTRVFDLGAFGLSPWFTAAQFPDPVARWIWTEKFANAGASVTTTPFSFYGVVTAPANTTTAALYLIVDDDAAVYVNGQQLAQTSGTWEGPRPGIPIQLAKGPNLLRINAINRGGPAGLIATVKDGAAVLGRTDGSWTWAATPMPPGSYINSCSGCGLSTTGVLTCFCKMADAAGTAVPTVAAGCPSYTNINGSLMCG